MKTETFFADLQIRQLLTKLRFTTSNEELWLKEQQCQLSQRETSSFFPSASTAFQAV